MTGQQIRRLHLKFYTLFPVSQAVTCYTFVYKVYKAKKITENIVT